MAIVTMTDLVLMTVSCDKNRALYIILYACLYIDFAAALVFTNRYTL